MFSSFFRNRSAAAAANRRSKQKHPTIEEETSDLDLYDSDSDLDNRSGQEAASNYGSNYEEPISSDSETNRDAIASSTMQNSKVSKTHSNQEMDKQAKNDNPLLPEELCEIPTFLGTKCCDSRLIEETRQTLKKKYKKRPENFSLIDVDRMLTDDWTVSRFLLRCRQDPKRAARLMELCAKFRLDYKMDTSRLSDFPIEFHKAGGLFRYAPDRVGNETIYMRVKMHRRCPELSQLMKSFILCVIEECDRANNGRGTAVIFDLSHCGISNADVSFLFWLLNSFRTYCPKGLSYIIVYNLPWILNATARIALSWLSSTNKRRLRFCNGEAIKDFIAPENLPDYLRGTCKLNYRRVPAGSLPAEELVQENHLSKEEAKKIKEIYEKFFNDVDFDSVVIKEVVDDETTTKEVEPELKTKGLEKQEEEMEAAFKVAAQSQI